MYEITRDGHLELTALREQAIRPLMSGPDPLGVALTFAADGMDREELRRMLRARREKLAIGGAEIAADLKGLQDKGFIDVLAAAIMRRVVLTSRPRSAGTTSSTPRWRANPAKPMKRHPRVVGTGALPGF